MEAWNAKNNETPGNLKEIPESSASNRSQKGQFLRGADDILNAKDDEVMMSEIFCFNRIEYIF
jgi:hypothetical protein